MATRPENFRRRQIAELSAYIDNWDKTHGKKFFYINKE